MQRDNEQGFLSGKFDDWSGEPIPNGWNSIENKIRKEKIRRRVLIGLVPAMVLLSLVFNNPAEKQGIIADNQSVLSKTENKNSLSVQPTGKEELAYTSHSLPEKGPNLNSDDVSLNVSSEPVSKIELQVPEKTSSSSSLLHQADMNTEEGLLAAENSGVSSLREGEISLSPDAHSNLEILNPKLATLIPLEYSQEPKKPEYRSADYEASNHKMWFNRSFTAQASWATSSIVMDQAASENWKYKAKGNSFSKAGTVALGFRVERPLNRTFALLYGVESGVFARYTELISTSKNPMSVEIQQEAESRFSVLQEFQSRKEIRQSLLFFGRTELGFRQALSRRSGLTAAAQLWCRLGSKAWSDMDGAAGFSSGKTSVSPGWRVGAWMQTGPYTQLEICYSALPESLAPETAGLQFTSSSLGISLKQGF
jgi:hypothetical protein